MDYGLIVITCVRIVSGKFWYPRSPNNNINAPVLTFDQ